MFNNKCRVTITKPCRFCYCHMLAFGLSKTCVVVLYFSSGVLIRLCTDWNKQSDCLKLSHSFTSVMVSAVFTVESLQMYSQVPLSLDHTNCLKCLSFPFKTILINLCHTDLKGTTSGPFPHISIQALGALVPESLAPLLKGTLTLLRKYSCSEETSPGGTACGHPFGTTERIWSYQGSL